MQNALHAALSDIVGMLNSPRYDDILLREAGVSLDRALFPLLVRIATGGPLGVVELADLVGRDHSTVSRQIGKLQAQGLIVRQPGVTDQRVRAAVLTPEGRKVVATLGAARDRLMERILDGWSAADCETLAQLNRRLADGMKRLRPD